MSCLLPAVPNTSLRKIEPSKWDCLVTDWPKAEFKLDELGLADDPKLDSGSGGVCLTSFCELTNSSVQIEEPKQKNKMSRPGISLSSRMCLTSDNYKILPFICWPSIHLTYIKYTATSSILNRKPHLNCNWKSHNNCVPLPQSHACFI